MTRDKLGFGFPNRHQSWLFYSPVLGDSLALALLLELKNDKVLKKLKDRERRKDWKRKKVTIFFVCVERIVNVTHKVKVQVKEKQRIV